MEKFCLKWNNFQSNASKSFSCLRKEEDFFDVTLVSDDEQHIAAHKLVLSASSEFFKNILKKTSHSNPLIYLHGFSSKYLQLMMDYIYEGETQIFQTDIDTFLEAGKKLKIEGLIGGSDESMVKNNLPMDENVYEVKLEGYTIYDTADEIFENSSSNENSKPRNFEKKGFSAVAETTSNNVDAKEKVSEMIMKRGDKWMCKTCGQTANTNSTIRVHAETHIEGLSFSCSHCYKTFRSRNAKNLHSSRYHK